MSKRSFKLDLLKTTLRYWWIKEPIKKSIVILMFISYPLLSILYSVMFLMDDKPFRWVCLGVALLVMPAGFFFTYKKYIRTIYRIVTGRCVKDIATTVFVIANGKLTSIPCPICTTEILTGHNLYSSLQKWINSGASINERQKLQCCFCGYKVEL